MENPDHLEKLLTIVRTIGLLLLLGGWGLSLHFMFLMGKDNPSLLLRILFTGWVSLPFLALLFLEWKLGSWKVPARLLLYGLMEAVAILSAIAYSGIFTFEGRPPAFIYLVVPACSLALIGAVYLLLRRMNASG